MDGLNFEFSPQFPDPEPVCGGHHGQLRLPHQGLVHLRFDILLCLLITIQYITTYFTVHYIHLVYT